MLFENEQLQFKIDLSIIANFNYYQYYLTWLNVFPHMVFEMKMNHHLLRKYLKLIQEEEFGRIRL